MVVSRVREPWRSLRLQVAVLGFAAIYAPVLLLLGVGLVSEEETVTVVDGHEVVATAGGGPSGWTVATAVLLAPAAAGLAWWWSGRAVLPLDRVRRAAADIEAHDLGQRIGLDRGPTEVVALAGAFDALLDRVEAAADVQRSLVEEASHELRTPLAVVLTNAEVALADPAPTVATQRAAIERSRDAARRMRGIVDALLVEARGRARALDRAAADVGAIVQDVVAEATPVATAAGAAVAVTTAGDTVAAIDADGVRRAVAALVENAVFHGAGPVTVTVDGAPERVTVTVTDDGPGIPPEEQERVFDRFRRGGSPAGGSGLGLAVARQVARAHGGDVTLASPTPGGRGCAFTLVLPR